MNKRVLLLMLAASLTISFGLFAAQVQTGSRTAPPQVVVFYANGCPHCAQMEKVLTALLVDRPNIKVARYEIHSPGAEGLLNRLALHYKIIPTQVPVIFVGKVAIIGAGRAQELALRGAVSDCVTHGCPSPLDYASTPAIPWNDILWLGVIVGAAFIFLLMQG